MKYQNLERILDKAWLKNNPNHPYNQWIMKSEDSKEKSFLHRLDDYLETAISLLNTKRIQSKLRNSQEFVDTYYELEVGCSLIGHGFEANFEYTLPVEIGNDKTPDIFVMKENIIVEIKKLSRSYEVEMGIKSGEVFKFNPAKRVKDRILDELRKYWGKGIKYPLIVMLCKDLINPPILTPDDLETVLFYRSDRGIFAGGEFYLAPDVEYEGLYYADNGRQADILSGVGLWRNKLIRFYENPNANKDSRIPQGRFLAFLKKSCARAI